MEVRNLTTLPDAIFLKQSINAMIDAVVARNMPLAWHWAAHCAAFKKTIEKSLRPHPPNCEQVNKTND